MVYDPINRHDIPLFTQKPSLDAKQWEQDSKNKWKKLINKIYFYIDINPEKLDPVTGKPYQILKVRNSE